VPPEVPAPDGVADGSRRSFRLCGIASIAVEKGRYYAAFVLDPDGNNVEAVRREFD
jgi:hypothetical protein